jgi:hypothetical protein
MVTEVALVAVTVNTDVAPEVMEVGLAAMVTVGTGGAVTVTVAVAVAVPPGPVAVTL